MERDGHQVLMFTDGSTFWQQVGPGEAIAPPAGFPLRMEASELLDPTWLMGYDWGRWAPSAPRRPVCRSSMSGRGNDECGLCS